MTGKKYSLFLQIAKRKGWSLVAIGERWGVSERQMTRISNSANTRDIDAVQGLPPFKEEVVMSELASYLGITDDQLDELDIEFQADTGTSGDMIYSYFFTVPENISADITKATGWKSGQLINSIPIELVESQEQEFNA